MATFRPGRALPSAVRDLVGELLYRTGWTRPDRAGRGYLTVITFHRVLPDEALREYPLDRIAVSVDDFQWLVQAFGRCFACGSLAEMHRRWTARQPTDRPLLAITFDDGQLDNFEHARPILERARATASFFVPVDAVDGNLPLWHDRLGYSATALLASDRPRALELLSRFGTLGALDDAELIRTTLARAKHIAPEGRLGYVSEIEAALPGPSRPAWDGAMSWDQLRELAR